MQSILAVVDKERERVWLFWSFCADHAHSFIRILLMRPEYFHVQVRDIARYMYTIRTYLSL